MKVKKIRIKTKEDFFKDLAKIARAIDSGKPVTPTSGEYFESLEAVRNVLTEKRLTLWRIIRDQHPNSILGLSKLADRDFKSVHRDIRVLVAAGIVELKTGRGNKGKTQVPRSLADSLTLEVA
jgi:predicted transcriptional regulator